MLTIVDNLFNHQMPVDKIALVEGDVSLSYGQLRQQVLKCMVFLNQQGIKAQCKIVILMNPGITASIWIYACVKLNITYIPIDVSLPDKLQSQTITNLEPACIVSDSQLNSLFNIKNYIAKSYEHTQYQQLSDIHADTKSCQLMLFSSGSAGKPKGIMISYAAVMNFVDWMCETFKLAGNHKIASSTPFFFDLSLFDIFAPMQVYATLYFIPKDKLTFPIHLADWFARYHISIWYTVPSALTLWTQCIKSLPNSLTLTRILFAGESIPIHILTKLSTYLANTEFYNLYGPTETNVCCYHKVDRATLSTKHSIPIGQPACHAVLAISTETNELMVKSPSNMMGYYTDCPQDDLFNNGYYLTNDCVSIDEDNNYHLHGRVDRQFKSRGYLINPEHIENIIKQALNISQCVITPDINCYDIVDIIAYIDKGSVMNDAEIINKLRIHLPSYAIPIKYIRTDIPLLANGKVDIKSLSHTQHDLVK